MVQIDVRGAPGRSNGVLGWISGLKPWRTGPKIFSQTAFRYPGLNSVDIFHGVVRADETQTFPCPLAKDPGALLKDPGVL